MTLNKLWLAAEKGDNEAGISLLRNGKLTVEVLNYTDPLNRSCFYMACRSFGAARLVCSLLENELVDIYVPFLKTGTTPLDSACLNNRMEVVQVLLKHPRVSVEKMGWREIHVKAAIGSVEEWKELLLRNDDGVDVNEPTKGGGFTPFFQACCLGRLEVVKLMMNDPRVDINRSNNNQFTPFSAACHNGLLEIVELLKADPRIDTLAFNNEQAAPFYVASYEGYDKVVKLLMDDPRIDVNQRNSENCTSLYAACQQQKIEVIKLLLNDPRVEVNLVNNRSLSPLFIPAQNGYTEVVSLLLSHRDISPNLCNRHLMTPFAAACKKNNLEIVEIFLLDPRTDPNLGSKSNVTPLFLACQEGHIQVVKWLLATADRYNLNIHVKTAPGDHVWNNKTPLEQAKKKEKTEVVELIEHYLRNPAELRMKLKAELGILNFIASDFYILIVLLSDGYLRVKSKAYHKKRRFFNFALRLPMDLQMLLCNRLAGSKKEYLSKKLTDHAFRNLIYAKKL